MIFPAMSSALGSLVETINAAHARSNAFDICATVSVLKVLLIGNAVMVSASPEALRPPELRLSLAG